VFIGHFGLAFASKRITPQLSLGTAFLAAQFLDLLWPTLLLAGVESVRIAPGATAVTPLVFEHYPFTHSLVAALLWAMAVGGAFWLLRRNARSAAMVAFLVLSHWLLDAVVHAPDLPIAPGLPGRVGLGLWNSTAGTLLVEVALFAGGAWLYASTTHARDRTGRFALIGLLAFLALIHLANVFGPPPPDVSMIAWAGHAQWLLVLWAYWIDAHRTPHRPVPA
jgi:hypothetical protein